MPPPTNAVLDPVRIYLCMIRHPSQQRPAGPGGQTVTSAPVSLNRPRRTRPRKSRGVKTDLTPNEPRQRIHSGRNAALPNPRQDKRSRRAQAELEIQKTTRTQPPNKPLADQTSPCQAPTSEASPLGVPSLACGRVALETLPPGLGPAAIQ